jgi:hypothetical protein
MGPTGHRSRADSRNVCADVSISSGSCVYRDYFWHFPQDAINDGVPWKLLEMQGEQRTIWAGSSACFESVLDVVKYNDLLFEMFGIKPKASAQRKAAHA